MPRSLVDPSGRFQGSGRWEWERCYLDGPNDDDRPALGWPEPRREVEASRGEQAPARTDAPLPPSAA